MFGKTENATQAVRTFLIIAGGRGGAGGGSADSQLMDQLMDVL